MSRDLSYLAKYTGKIDPNAYNVQSGVAFPRISCGSERFTAIDEEGNETFLSISSVDFIVVDTNPHASKVYYKDKYDGSTPTPPTCWSDNGFAPDLKVYEPQAQFCHECPKGQWGSAISEGSGKAIKACSDYKKLAVFLLSDEKEGIFQFRVPSASLSNWGKYVMELARFPTGSPSIKILPHMVVTRAKWSDKKNVLTFERVDFLDEEWLEVILEHQDKREYEEWIGLDNASQSRRQLESVKMRPAPLLEHHTKPGLNDRNSDSTVIDVQPEKAPPAPRKRPSPRQAVAEQEPLDPHSTMPLKRPGAPRQEKTNGGAPAAPAMESAMDRARRRAQERIAAETGR